MENCGRQLRIAFSLIFQRFESTKVEGSDQTLLQDSDSIDSWKNIKYNVFDAPNYRLLDEPAKFEDRIKYANENIAAIAQYSPTLISPVKVVDMVSCKGKQHLEEFFEKVMDKGARGISFRKPHSLYEKDRHSNLLKFEVVPKIFYIYFML